MKKIIVALGVLMASVVTLHAQWSLDSCIAYAEEHSFDVQRAIVELRNAELAYSTARVSMTPSVNAGVGQDFSFGLAQGADNIKQPRTQASTSFNASVNMPLFTGLKITNQIRRTKIEIAASEANVEGLRNNIAVNVASYYLNALYNTEMVTISEQQLALRKKFMEHTAQLVEAGKKSESELYEAQAQVAQDSSALTDARINLRQSIVDLCQLLNWTDIEAFALAPMSNVEIAEVLLSPAEEVYNHALSRHPTMRSSLLQIESAKYAIREAKADYYPQLSLNASWGTGYYHVFNGNNPGFGQQFVDNGSEMVGVYLSIPIYNRLQVRNNIKMSKNALQLATINNSQQAARLYKEIQSAYYNALSSQEKYRAALTSYQTGKTALDYAVSKYELGRMNAYEYNEVQSRYARAAAELTQSKYDFSLRYRILQHYANL